MKKPTTISKESVSEYREFVQLRLRKRVLEAIEVVLEEEVDQALGCRSYERAEDRRGYRNGAETRRVTTSVGTRELRVPRARVRDEETGETTEFRSELLPRYARRTREVDEAILGTYLSGANSRRIRKALKPLLGEEHLSKSAVSRVVSRLKECFEEWQNRALSEEVYAIVYLDGFHLKVRMAKRVIGPGGNLNRQARSGLESHTDHASLNQRACTAVKAPWSYNPRSLSCPSPTASRLIPAFSRGSGRSILYSSHRAFMTRPVWITTIRIRPVKSCVSRPPPRASRASSEMPSKTASKFAAPW